MNNLKIKTYHLSKKAIVYIRQSSPGQVLKNIESQNLQYALVDKAKSLGWSAIEVIDEDLGKSASEGSNRIGFKKLISKVAMGEIGIIFSREASRLSRSNKDWGNLFEICRISDTLLGDDSNIYDINSSDDQLILGIKATMSIAELSIIKTRMLQGQENKALRGELYRIIAPGYICLDGKKLIKDPNTRVHQSIEIVFKKFKEVPSVRQLMKWFHEEEIELPVNKFKNGSRNIAWQLPKYSFLKYILQNPVYAGVYYYGCNESKKILGHNQTIIKKTTYRKPEESRIFIKNHHEGYISWEDYEENQKMISANNNKIAKSDETATGIRQGHGLLAGLIRCGWCGRKLHVRYWGKHGTAARYLCKGDFDSGGKYCLGFGGATIDRKISEEVLNIIEPFTLDASIRAIEELSNKKSEKEKSLELKIKQVEYETQKSFEQYDLVDPRNRLVAETLEKRWNSNLITLKSLKDDLSNIQKEQTNLLSKNEKKEIMSLGKNLEELWNKENQSITIKKKIIRILIEEIVVSLDESTNLLKFILHWHGDSHTEISMPKPLSAIHKKTSEEDLDIIKKMANNYEDDQIARVLSKLGRKTSKGKRWNETRVKYVRKKYNIESNIDKNTNEEILSLGQAERYAGVSDTTIMKLIKTKILKANQIVPYAPLEIKKQDLDSEPVKSILQNLKDTGKLTLNRDPLPKQQSLF